jgi:putative ABC transport system permease protein
VPILRLQQLLRISTRNFWRFRLQAVIISLATMMGTAGVIVSTGYAAGGRQKILDQFSQLGANIVVVSPDQSRSVGGRARTGSVVTTLKASDYKAITQAVADISSSSPTVSGVLRVRAGDLTKNTTIVGCNPDYFAIKHWSASYGVIFDNAAAKQQARVAMLGATAARDLYGGTDPTGSRIMINRVPFAVAGVMDERGQSLDASNEDDQLYIPLETAMHRLMNVDYFNAIFIEIDSSSHMESAVEGIHNVLRERHRRVASNGEDFLLQNRKSLLETQLTSFARFTFLVRWIAVSALVVSSFGILSLTWMGLRHRTREIGTRRAIGATRFDILIQFFIEGTIGVLFGSGSGMVIAYLVLMIIDRRLDLPLLFSAPQAFGEVLSAFSIYSVFTLLSSLRAIKVQPMLALQSE